ncbi:MAG: LysR family transcriptional regulator [Saprospiraceae bacterium]|nr:LysR family transcriptional regulator [Saprospiraceae bacterium]
MMIRKLEDELDTRIFDRDRQPVVHPKRGSGHRTGEACAS